MGADRTECPHAGNVGPTRKCRPLTPGSQKLFHDRRAAWLAGYDGQKEAMQRGKARTGT